MSRARKLAAILAADVAGYSRLMGEDEAGTAKAVRERREAAMPIVRTLGGRLVKTTGDGLLLEFPSVVAAVECAILIQKMMAESNAALPEAKRILYRIGVNLGDVLIEGDDIFGDGVNVAARLEGICEPGGVCASGSVYEQVQGRVSADFSDLGEQSLKNIARRVRVYVLSSTAVTEARVEAPEPASDSSSSPPVSGGEPRRLSIVVLPFANIGGDPEQDYFVDGVTGSLTTDLSRIRNVGLARFALRIERIELLLEALLRRFAGVDGAADPCAHRRTHLTGLNHFRSPKPSPRRSRDCRASLLRSPTFSSARRIEAQTIARR